MPRPRKWEDDEILAAARQVFLDKGPRASLRTVAASIGMSQPALSQRFGSRDALLLRALTPVEVPAWLAALEAAPVADARATLVALGRQGLAVLEEALPCLLTLRMSEVDVVEVAGLDAPHLIVEQAVTAWFARAAEAGAIAPGDPAARAMAFIGTLQAYALRRWVAGVPTSVSDVDALIDVLWRGIAPEGARA